MYPELQTDINREVKEFVLGKVNNFKCVDRSKSKVPNIGEFIVKLFLSTHDYNDKKVKTALLEEYFARQIFWMKQKVNFSMLRCTTLLRYFEAAEVSNRLLAFNILAAKTFIIKGVTGRLDANYGLPPSHIVQYFQNEIKKIKNITAYNSLISFINYSDVITSAQDMVDFLKKAINISNAQGYTKI